MLAVSVTSMKETLLRYIQRGRDALVWKLEGASEYDIRRPMVPSGTNLLGLVKHVAAVEAGYFGDVFGRPFPEHLEWADEDAEPLADMWATADESRDEIIDLYHRVWKHADETIALTELDTRGTVPWWPEERRHPTLHDVMVHVIGENSRHAGHADILRELIDGSKGQRPDIADVEFAYEFDWEAHYARLEQAAQDAPGRS